MNIEDIDLDVPLSNYDKIVSFLDDMQTSCLYGEDIEAMIENLDKTLPEAFLAISSILSLEEENFRQFIQSVERSPEEKEEIDFIRKHFKNLSDKFESYWDKKLGKVNPWSKIQPYYSVEVWRGIPFVDLRIYSHGELTYQSVDRVDRIYDFAIKTIRCVLECLEETKGYDIRYDDLFFELMESLPEETLEDNQKILELVEKLSEQIKNEDTEL